MVKFKNKLIVIFIYLSLSILISGCNGTKAYVNENWSLVRLITQGERTDETHDEVIVRNCGVLEKKTITCSAGTSNDLSVSIGGTVDFATKFTGSISADVSSSLGINRTLGESLELESPPNGYIYTYEITTTYHVMAGKAIVESSSGDEKDADYAFHAGCSLQENTPDVSSCTDQSDTNLPTATQLPTSKTESASVHGQVRWDSQPVEEAEVSLGTPGGDLCWSKLLTPSAFTDATGNYNLPIPDSTENSSYNINIHIESWGRGWCWDSPVKVGTPSTYEFDVDLLKDDLKILSSEYGDYTSPPPISWEKYPDASRYYIEIDKKSENNTQKIVSEFVGGETTYTPSITLSPGEYWVYIWAYNKNDVAISSGSFFFNIVQSP